MLNNLFGPIGYVFKNDMASKNIFLSNLANVRHEAVGKKWGLKFFLDPDLDPVVDEQTQDKPKEENSFPVLHLEDVPENEVSSD